MTSAEAKTAKEGNDTAWLIEKLDQKDASIANLTTMMEGMGLQIQSLQEALPQLA